MDVSSLPAILTKSSRAGLLAGFERRMVQPVAGCGMRVDPLYLRCGEWQLSYEVHAGRGLELAAPVSVGFLR